MFEEIAQWANQWFDPAVYDASGRPCIPIELKVLRSECYPKAGTLTELQSCRSFF
jgi:hypothetical protein